ncbi:hypothetical protein R1sor_026212 [Riccia sorocarpa]|uniref:RPA43 OB domain-containing protein n=1 Tax=Riccia sorocarpa TaxID=122646 RepID=A0ABD3GGF1_9MARC
MEGLAVVHAKIGVFFPPSRAANVKQGVHDIRIGIRILAGLTPYFDVNLTAKLLIFSPSPGMLLEGKVNKVEKDYIGVVVLVLFNAAIGVSDIREDLYYNGSPNGREWGKFKTLRKKEMCASQMAPRILMAQEGNTRKKQTRFILLMIFIQKKEEERVCE